MVADTGSGLIVLAVLFVVVLVSIGWCGFWSARRWSGGNLRESRALVAVFVATLLALLLAPPMRRRGIWVENSTGARADTAYSAALDRFWYGGFMPESWKWIGCAGEAAPLPTMKVGELEPIPITTTVGISPGPDCTVEASYWTIDWIALTIQDTLVFLWFLPFLFSKNSDGTDFATGNRTL